MSIPDHRLSTEVHAGNWLEPDDRQREVPYWDYERGPIAIGDTSEGLDYQNWTMRWNPINGNFETWPTDAGTPVTIITNVPTGVSQASFCFDQNGQASVTWIENGQAKMYWYNTDIPGWTTDVLAVDIVSTLLSLDDKRVTQTQTSDMILWYTRETSPGQYDLFTREQRDRFEIEYPMKTNVGQFVVKGGMNDVLRVQVATRFGL